MIPRTDNYFPTQRVDAATKSKAEWYTNCIDYVIDAGLSYNDRVKTETQIAILHGNIPNEFYKKTLNPYNSNNEKYTRFPATMRNFDIMSDVIRRYVSEYFKGVHEFVVGASNADIILKKNARLAEEVGKLAQQAFQQEFMQRLQQMQQEAQQNGTSVEQINPQDAMPNIDEFVKNFNENYIDDESKQAQDLLDYIRSVTADTMIYLTAFFHYVSFGECYTYADVRGEEIIKECVPVLEAFPVPNSNFFVEDHDMFARRMMLSYSQIMDMFDAYLTEKDRTYLETYYSHSTYTSPTKLLYNQYFETYPDVCEKFTKEERKEWQDQPITIASDNTNLFEVWHVVWRGEVRKGVLTYINEVGMPATRIVEEDYKLNKEAGDISIEWEYDTQVYEGYRIGNRYNAVYPIKARAIAYNRDGKLPYNGIMEVLPYFGKFSIVSIMTPYQIMRNIFSYHREMVIAKNKMLILLLPESLVADKSEDRVYRMAADGVLMYDDSEDTNSIKAQQIRLLNANLGDYIAQITDLMAATKQEAWDVVDMNAQRYGDIAQSAGAATTQEAIARSSMGSVIITLIFDEMRKKDYQRDLEYAKLAYIDGLNTAYFDDKGVRRYISLDVNSFIYSKYGVLAKNDAKELDKIKQLKDWAFSAAQNGDLESAIAAITGDNVSQIKATVQKFMDIKRQHELDMQQAEQQIKQAELEGKIAEIQAKGEEDRKTKELEYYYKMQLAYVDVDMSRLGEGNDDAAEAAKQRLAEATANNKAQVDRDKLNLERQKLQLDTYNAAAERQVKREQMENQLKIAKTNKNKYDK